jgi:hypothetical protein
LARSEGLLVEIVDSETVVYDTDAEEIHCLAPLAAAVFEHCDGSTTVKDLAGLASSGLGEPVTVEQVESALAQLEKIELVAAPPRGISRRTLVRKTAVATAAITATPLITSIVTPAYAQIISPTPGCPRGVCSSQGNGTTFCNNLGCPDPQGLPRDSCECILCCVALGDGDVESCPYQCNGDTPVNPPPCPPTGTPGGCRPGQQGDFLDGVCLQRPGDTSEPCETP